jgi:YHS domain-containing protein
MKLSPITLTLAALCIAGTALAAKISPINVDKKGVALHGYDPVSYFELDKPLPGSAAVSYAFGGAKWWFSSAENRQAFAQNKNKYLPQYGGYCAKAVSENQIADVDPLAYKIVEGKLFLNYDMRVQKIWEKDMAERIAKANANWPALRSGK